MRRSSLRILYCMALVLFCAATSMFAANMQLQNAFPNGSLAGVYIGPYTALIDGVSTQVICDDYSSETYIGQSWTANVSTFADLSGTKFGDSATAVTKYKEVAWLSLQLLNPPYTCPLPSINCAGDIQFAIWQVFDSPNPFNDLGPGADSINSAYWLGKAATESANFTASDLSAFSFYTPTPLVPGVSPQEFVVVKAPEASEIVLLAIDLSAVAGVYLLFRRRSLKHRST
jgi:hypothetical protein